MPIHERLALGPLTVPAVTDRLLDLFEQIVAALNGPFTGYEDVERNEAARARPPRG